MNGEFKASRTGAVFETVNPATGRVLEQVAEATAEDVDDAVRAARRAFRSGDWSRLPAARRSQFLYDIAARIEDRTAEIAELESRDSGMPITMTRYGHLPRAVAHFRHFAEEAERARGETYPLDGDYLYVVNREPIGVTAIFAPWNAPLAVASINVAAALAFGNTCILKPSEKSPLSAQVLAGIFDEAGVPPGVLNVVTGPPEPTGRALAEHPFVDAISFVGGTSGGRSILRAAAHRVARVALELGGKSAAIVFADTDLERAVDGLTLSAFSSNGEVCTAASRILVERPIFDTLVDALVERAERIVVADPLSPACEMGPLISDEHRRAVESRIASATREGALLRCGATRPSDLPQGYFLRPAIMTSTSHDLDICREEVFGPVSVVLPFDTTEEAVRLANDTLYGLAAYVWTGRAERALDVAGRLRAGTVAINSPVVRDIRVPFGGFGQSGLGRVGGTHSRELFTEIKAVCLPVNPLDLPRLGVGRGADEPR